MVNSLSTQILCSAASLFMCSRNLQDDLEELVKIKDELTALRACVLQKVTDGGGPKTMPLCLVKDWLSNVEVKVAEVNKLLRYGVEGFWSKICFGRKVEEILSELMVLKNTIPSEPTIVGLENKLEEVWNCLTVDEVGVIGIWGMGGIGKTTLLTQLYSKCHSHFDLVIWLQVSHDVKLEDLQEEFVKQIGLSKEKKSNDNTALISQVLHKKKVLVLLDDLWNRVELKDIGFPQNIPCHIVFTTRSKVVCRLMEAPKSIRVKPLACKDARRLFQDRVGFEIFDDTHSDIRRIAGQIVAECEGLPLALITSAHVMRSSKTLQDWKDSVEILSKSASSQEELIDKWIGEGFLDAGVVQANPIIAGYNIIETLVDLSLLEDKGEEVRMHHVILDMCLWMGCEVEKEQKNYFVGKGSQFRKEPSCEEMRDARRISLMGDRGGLFILPLLNVPGSPHLSTLLLSSKFRITRINDGFFRYLKALTVLDLSGTGLRFLPTDIEELVSLQYLDISTTEIEVLPQGIMELEKLQCLNLEFTPELRNIPTNMIDSLKLLQVFRIVGSGFVLCESSVIELERLENLKALSITVKDACIYHHILNRPKLSSCIQTLITRDIRFPSYGVFSQAKPHKFLDIEEEMRCFDKLVRVQIDCCHNLEDLTWLMHSPNMTKLIVTKCDNLQVIISHEVEEKDLNLFERLQVLELIELPQLKSICWKPMPFPLLDKIRVSGCPMLKKLPLSRNSAKGQALVIRGTINWWTKLEWEDDATRIAFQSCLGELVSYRPPYRRDGTIAADQVSPFHNKRKYSY